MRIGKLMIMDKNIVFFAGIFLVSLSGFIIGCNIMQREWFVFPEWFDMTFSVVYFALGIFTLKVNN